ncbi:hypothetical protein [Winogradskyella alexanderae]|uniref:O-antigen ligase domain-containing protein n=1 Tax=Winogradskyella alexanderae TaxID=2877123 RepID=A0ABS7XMR5_9FLAO|nr:hypothetical protein [Winogradskyella alexanderae]MCA0131299.1 hypothetical protein [Winogradskyella alexanderae]
MQKTSLHKIVLFASLVLILLSVPLGLIVFELGQNIKAIGLILIVLGIVYSNRTNVFFYALILLIFYIVFLGFYREIHINQLFESGIRYCLPIIALLYGLQLRTYKKPILTILITFIVLNDVYQLLNWLISPIFNNTFSYHLERASGFVGFFDFFGFINMIGLVLINHTNELNFKKKTKLTLSIFFTLFVIWSLSLKMIVILVFYILFFQRRLLFLAIPTIPLIIIFHGRLKDAISIRLNRYIIKPSSARSESYRVLKDYYEDFITFGQGPGTFGGPVSTKYNSLLYEKYNFNWFGEQAMATTDTYYPHLFVELGLFFGVFYLFICLILPIISLKKKMLAFLILSILAINSVFSFAFNSLPYCLFSFMLIYLINEVNFDLNALKFYKGKKNK